jgi:site-specific recombinase XerD
MNNDSILFYRLIRNFLTLYLPRQKAASNNTVKSYRETLNLFIDYLSHTLGCPLAKIGFECITRKRTEEFLEWLENGRGCSVSSRNQRLSGLKSFFKYAAEMDKSTMAVCQEIFCIPKKKQEKPHEIEFFNESALQSILEQPTARKKTDVRNLVFMILMYDTGARVQEVLDLCVGDIHMEKDSHYVILTGKGKKTRAVPIMKKTQEHLASYLIKFHPKPETSDPLFYVERNGRKGTMSGDNVEKFVKRYGELARKDNPNVPEHIYPHMWRHSRSMHLYRNGMPLPLVAEWLGHTNIETTLRYYANADISMKRDAIEKATSELNPLFRDNPDINWEDDEELLKKLYGLV